MQKLSQLAIAMALAWAGLSGVQTNGDHFWLEWSQIPNVMKMFGVLATLILWNKVPAIQADSKNFKIDLSGMKKAAMSPWTPILAFAALPALVGASVFTNGDPKVLAGLLADSTLIAALVGRRIGGKVANQAGFEHIVALVKEHHRRNGGGAPEANLALVSVTYRTACGTENYVKLTAGDRAQIA